MPMQPPTDQSKEVLWPPEHVNGIAYHFCRRQKDALFEMREDFAGDEDFKMDVMANVSKIEIGCVLDQSRDRVHERLVAEVVLF